MSQPHKFFNCSRRCVAPQSSSHRQSKPKPTAPAWYTLTFNANVAALGFNQLPGNGQPQARPTLFAGARFVGPPEAIEDVGQIFGGDTGPGIGYSHSKLTADRRPIR
jgi:hypothetical protein